MKLYVLGLLGLIFCAEIIYYNIAYDIILVLFLLFTAFSVGSFFHKIRLSFLDKVLVQLSVGLGLVSLFVWFSTFYNFSYKSLYLLASLIVIYFQKRTIYQNYIFIKNKRKDINKFFTDNFILVVVLISFFILYLIPASSPISTYDALVKHIAIPSRILNSSNYDYNVIESIVYGDYALLSHMLSLYLLSLGGTKALVILNLVMSFLTLLTVMRISSFFYKGKLHFFLISLLYFTTPLFYTISTTLSVDLFPLYFVFTAILLLQYNSLCFLRKNLYLIAMLCGFAMFSKQTAFYYIIPLLLLVLYNLFHYRSRLVASDFLNLTKSVFIGLFCFILPILIIFYKTGNPLFPFMNSVFQSEYFPRSNFVDPYNNYPLGLNLHSLYEIVFETYKHTEYPSGGVGFYILLIPLVFIMLIKRSKKFVLLVFLALFSYWVSTIFSNNIRYSMGTIILLIPLITYSLLNLLPNKKVSGFIGVFLVSIISIYQVSIIFSAGNGQGFKPYMLNPDARLVKNAHATTLDTIPNAKDKFVLSNNDAFRGTFEGHYYVLDWYNPFLLENLKPKSSELNVLMQFDYYLIDKRMPLTRYTTKLKPENVSQYLDVHYESLSHILYKVNKVKLLKDFKLIYENSVIYKQYKKPISVSSSKPEFLQIANRFKAYKITLELDKGANKVAQGRFQINWLDKDGVFITTSLIPFDIDIKRQYTSPVISDIPDNAVNGIVYFNSNDDKLINIYSYKIKGVGQMSNIDKFNLIHELKKYNAKFPHMEIN